ncbi:SLBB domain-containing protein [Dokdonia sp. PRO95]|uniref:SLBB domain-containing protein n=1 Tax=Dokdonia sp. PRO95 TaxID=1239415 RepID=UPI00135F1960|nr:SLBB domain-containing protein [Dokdonia sp. PRO95]
MKDNLGRLLLIVLMFSFSVCFSQEQTLSLSQISSVNIDDLSDSQIASYWDRAKGEGYTLQELANLARLQGVSESEILKLNNRILGLPVMNSSLDEAGTSDVPKDKTVDSNYGLTVSSLKKDDVNSLDDRYFGYSFFSNPSISFEPNYNVTATKDYVISTGDEITIDLWGAAERSSIYTVGQDGNIQLPGVGKIFVSGYSLVDVEGKIKSRLRNVFAGLYAPVNSPSKIFLDINISKVRNIQINVIGDVKVPGTYTLAGLSRVMNALYASGGPTLNGSLRKIKVTREGRIIGVLDVYDFIFKGNSEGNLILKEGDVIIVPSFESRVTVKGEVKNPAIFEITQGESIKDVIAFAGGYTPLAYKNVHTIDRIDGIGRKIVDISEVDFNSSLFSGDILSVQKITELYNNRVIITGAVNLPGAYELKDGMKLGDLINRAEGFNEKSSLKKVLLFRENSQALRDVYSFNLEDSLVESSKFLLKKEDSIKVFFKSNLRSSSVLSIRGAVNNPKSIPFVDKMRVTDLIAIAGGFAREADPNVINVSRQLDDGEFKTLSINYTWESTSDLILKTGANFYLQPNDKVEVRTLKGYQELKSVYVNGEVSRPGAYSILNKNERISSLVARSGGLSPYAFLEGGTIIRKKVENDKKQVDGALDLIQGNLEEGTTIKNVENEYRIGIDLKKAIVEKDERYDLILREGDRLLIPSKKQTVEVVGEVMSPSLIPYSKKLRTKDYIYNGGGFSEKAKKSKVYVVHPNGTVLATKRFLFFRMYPKVIPGSLILVPKKIDTIRDGLSTQEAISITTGLGTLAIIIDRLAN